MEFDWNDAKRRSNIAKHQLDFVSVIGCFMDENRLVWEDNRYEYGEQRFNMLALYRDRIFHITFTNRGEVTWLISARKANLREQRRYARHNEG